MSPSTNYEPIDELVDEEDATTSRKGGVLSHYLSSSNGLSNLDS
jgi:hypothetical protein